MWWSRNLSSDSWSCQTASQFLWPVKIKNESITFVCNSLSKSLNVFISVARIPLHQQSRFLLSHRNRNFHHRTNLNIMRLTKFNYFSKASFWKEKIRFQMITDIIIFYLLSQNYWRNFWSRHLRFRCWGLPRIFSHASLSPFWGQLFCCWWCGRRRPWPYQWSLAPWTQWRRSPATFPCLDLSWHWCSQFHHTHWSDHVIPLQKIKTCQL